MKIPILNIQAFEQEAPLNDFYSNNFRNHIASNKEFFHKPHSHDFYLCVIFTSGSGRHEIDFNSYAIQSGSVFFLKPGQSHFWNFDTIPEGYIFFHTKEFYDLHFLDHKLNSFPFYFSDKNPPFLILPPTKIKKAAVVFKEINKEYENNRIYKKLKLPNLLNTLYIDLAREYSSLESDIQVASPAYIKTLGDLEKFLEQSFRTEKSAVFYAGKLNITTKHLNRITKSTLNKTTTEIITDRVILEAKRLIVHSPNTLSNISDTLGFSEYAYFSKVFKSKTEMTPLQFKRSYQEIK